MLEDADEGTLSAHEFGQTNLLFGQATTFDDVVKIQFESFGHFGGIDKRGKARGIWRKDSEDTQTQQPRRIQVLTSAGTY